MSRVVNKEGIFSDVFTWMGKTLSTLFSKAEPTVVDAIKQFFDTFEAVAVDAVAAEAPKVISGSEKFSNAVANVQQAVIAKGWTASVTILETIVQDAYTAWKASQKPVPGELLVKAPQ